MLRQESYARKREEHKGFDSRRNPYLTDYEEQRSRRARQTVPGRQGTSGKRTGQNPADRWGRESYSRPASARSIGTGGRISHGGSAADRPFLYEEGEEDELFLLYGGAEEGELSLLYGGEEETRPRRRRSDIDEKPVYRQLPRRTAVRGTAARGTAGHRRMAGRRARRKKILRRRLMVGVWMLCLLALGVAFVLRNSVTAANGGKEGGGFLDAMGNAFSMGQNAGSLVQGIPEKAFASHPRWEENFLTPNEYSRPGDALESVENVFVHYTANPGTSAAQNRSYFEQQKDTHEASVSSHFIIGYDGEIIQCVPLDEIAYAVMTRNYDSISIECCYLERDGSFTQETYDSLVSLLAWLTDVYDLDTEDILRHYDCGGKKCPLYYTEHPDAWEQLKKDVDKL